jgi:hypothetical protein
MVITAMWWLQFAEGAAIVAATSLAQARLLAVIHGFGRASALVEGFAIDPEFLELIPNDSIGRRLSSSEAEEVLGRLRISARRSHAALLDGSIRAEPPPS